MLNIPLYIHDKYPTLFYFKRLYLRVQILIFKIFRNSFFWIFLSSF